jgi:hypothetical protein
MLGSDVQIEVADLIVDERARHFWDGGKQLGRYFANLGGSESGAVAWDVFFFYPPGATWGDEPTAVGAPVIVEAARLEAALRPYLT